MDIHQIEVRYLPEADRLLMQVRTRQGGLVAVWLTRRLMLRLWPPLQELATRLVVARTAPDAVALPEAREMLAQTARERALKDTDFATPFDRTAAEHPLGSEPLLASKVELTPTPQGGMSLAIHEHRGRHITLTLTESLAAAVAQLIQSALAASEWGVPAAALPVTAQAPRTLLN